MKYRILILLSLMLSLAGKAQTNEIQLDEDGIMRVGAPVTIVTIGNSITAGYSNTSAYWAWPAHADKPGKFEPWEYEIMKTHAEEGAKIIHTVKKTVENEELKENYLGEAENMAHYHHEKWNGQGYPCGLKGEEIPLSARIMAVADVFDALVAVRVYKPAMPFEKAVSIIKEGSGEHFDPDVVEAFVNAEEKIRAVTDKLH